MIRGGFRGAEGLTPLYLKGYPKLRMAKAYSTVQSKRVFGVIAAINVDQAHTPKLQSHCQWIRTSRITCTGHADTRNVRANHESRGDCHWAKHLAQAWMIYTRGGDVIFAVRALTEEWRCVAHVSGLPATVKNSGLRVMFTEQCQIEAKAEPARLGYSAALYGYAGVSCQRQHSSRPALRYLCTGGIPPAESQKMPGMLTSETGTSEEGIDPWGREEI
ncbi:hypothetical protein EDB92DRAFT_1820127 [Lactarius akahatsu]|uniref:Uncharacterized protein n=1 Tax=Lactarius akahatsu TaxID=416441 RepID=A0AAD4Q8V7_9AGAM|nr:hypothetical protein EDB92DRAFT_1820127 [Lactarius akahatsu]